MNRIRLSLIALGIIGTSLSAAWIVNGVETDMEHPLQPPVRSIENGGNVPAIDAYEDGVGVFMKGSPGSDATQIDNSAFNRLVFKYGPAAKANGISIFDQVLSGTNTPPATPEDIALANIIKGNTIASDFFADGTECDDQNPDTLNDIYTDGICIGTYINGTPCDDDNSETINDVYNGGICSGICDDGNPDTADSLQEDGTCLYQFIDGVACDDNHDLTINDIYINGICAGTPYTDPNLKFSLETENTFIDNSSIKTITTEKYCKNFTLSFYAKTTIESGFSDKGHVPGETEQFIFNAIHGGETFDGVGVSFGLNGVATYEHSSNNLPRNGYSDYIFNSDTYYKITYVYEDSIPTLYINNQYILTGVKSPRDNACSPMDIGFGNYSKSVTSSVKNILIFDRAFNSSEITEIP